MNKLSTLLLVATIFAVNAQAEYGWKNRDGGQNGHPFFEMQKEKWNNAIDALTNKTTKTDAKKLLQKIEKQHKNMITIRQNKHTNMNKLNEMLGLPTTREVVQDKMQKVKTAVKEKAQQVKARVKEKVDEVKADVKNKVEKAKEEIKQKKQMDKNKKSEKTTKPVMVMEEKPSTNSAQSGLWPMEEK